MVQYVVVIFVFAEDLELVVPFQPGGNSRYNGCILVLFEDHASSVPLFAADGARQDRSLLEGFEEGGPAELQEHEANELFEAEKGSPIEDA